jgi:hypothetical protein
MFAGVLVKQITITNYKKTIEFINSNSKKKIYLIK